MIHLQQQSFENSSKVDITLWRVFALTALGHQSEGRQPVPQVRRRENTGRAITTFFGGGYLLGSRTRTFKWHKRQAVTKKNQASDIPLLLGFGTSRRSLATSCAQE